MATAKEMEELNKKRRANVLRLEAERKANPDVGILRGMAREAPGVVRDAASATAAAGREVPGVLRDAASATAAALRDSLAYWKEKGVIPGTTEAAQAAGQDVAQGVGRVLFGQPKQRPTGAPAVAGTTPEAQRVLAPPAPTGQGAPAVGEGGRGIYQATPAATSMADFLKQKAVTNAVMRTGAGSTHEAQARVTRQGELDKMAREGMAASLQKTQIQAGGEQALAQGEQSAGILNSLIAAKAEIVKASGPTADIDAQIAAITAQRGQEAGGSQDTLSDIGTQAPQGTPAVPKNHKTVYDEVEAGFEKAGYDLGRMTPAEQRAWAELKKLYPYLALQKAQKA